MPFERFSFEPENPEESLENQNRRIKKILEEERKQQEEKDLKKKTEKLREQARKIEGYEIEVTKRIEGEKGKNWFNKDRNLRDYLDENLGGRDVSEEEEKEK